MLMNDVLYTTEWSEVKWSEVKWSEVKWSEVKWSEDTEIYLEMFTL